MFIHGGNLNRQNNVYRTIAAGNRIQEPGYPILNECLQSNITLTNLKMKSENRMEQKRVEEACQREVTWTERDVNEIQKIDRTLLQESPSMGFFRVKANDSRFVGL